MTLRDEVEKLVVRLAPQPICDDCLARTLHLSVLHNVDQAARELAGSNGFERRRDVCSLCGEDRPVIARN